MDSTFHIVTVMPLDTAKIRHEIRNVLKSGLTRSTKIVEKVKKKVGSEKTIYRQIQEMRDLGEIRPIEYNRAHIEYELIQLSDYVEKNLQVISNFLNEVNDDLTTFHEQLNQKTKPIYLQRLSTIVFNIKRLQNIETRLRILSIFPAFEKSKSYSKIEKEIVNTWKSIDGLIGHNKEKQFVNEILMNFNFIRLGKVKVIEKS